MIEEELKKGCGNDWEDKYGEIHTCGRYVRVKLGKKGSENVLCPTCQARLEGFQKGKLEQMKKELRFLKSLRFDKVWDMAYPKVEKRIKQLQKEIGGNKK